MRLAGFLLEYFQLTTQWRCNATCPSNAQKPDYDLGAKYIITQIGTFVKDKKNKLLGRLSLETLIFTMLPSRI